MTSFGSSERERLPPKRDFEKVGSKNPKNLAKEYIRLETSRPDLVHIGLG